MKKRFEIIKSRLYAKTDYTELIEQKRLGSISLSYNELDSLRLHSGAICVFDAYNHSQVKPYIADFEISSCTPFYMTVLTSLGSRIALTGLKFGAEKAIEWKLALKEEKDVIKLTADSVTAMSMIDSGIICFADTEGFFEFEKSVKRHAEHDSHPLDGKLNLDGTAALLYPLEGGCSVAVFSSGWGEGNYPCYVGYSADGKPVGFICDFGLLDYNYKEDASQTVSFEFDVDPEEIYVNDPHLSVDENNVKKWSLVLSFRDELDEMSLYKAYSRRGLALHRLERYEEALKDYYAALAVVENGWNSTEQKLREWTLYENAGAINRQLGNVEEAVRLFEKAKNIDDSFYSGAYVNLIDIYTDERNYDKAIEICGEMMQKRPLDPTAYVRRAAIHVSLGNYAAAADDYDVLVKKFMWDDGVWDQLFCLISLERFTQAQKILEELQAANSVNEVYYYYFGLLEYKRHDYTKAFENLLKSYEYNPYYVPTLGLLIEINDLFLDYTSARDWAEKYIECRPSGAYGYHVRAEQNMHLRNYRAAAEDRTLIAEKFDGSAESYRSIVCAYLMAKDFSKAKKTVKKLKSIDGDGYFNALGLYYMAKGNTMLGERYLLSAAQSGKSETYIADLADAYIYLEKYDAAAEQLLELENSYPLSVRAAFTEIALCKKIHDGSELKAAYKRYIDAFLPGLEGEQKEELISRLWLSAAI